MLIVIRPVKIDLRSLFASDSLRDLHSGYDTKSYNARVIRDEHGVNS